MRFKRLPVLTLTLALGFQPVGTALAVDTAWTMRDVEAVADKAAARIAETKDQNTASMFAQLAGALVKAGATARARELFNSAIAVLDPPKDFAAVSVRRQIVRDLVKLGDDGKAETLTDVNANASFKVTLLGELGVARAQADNVEGAKKAADAIVALGSPGETQLLMYIDVALKNIGAALVEKGALDAALQVANGAPNKATALPIIARVATALCASKNARGSDLAARAASDARVIAAEADKPYLIVDPIIVASAAVAACGDISSATAFIRGAISPQIPNETRLAIVDKLINGGQTALALALAPPPQPGDALSLLEHAKRLKRAGDLVAAKAATLEVSRTIIETRDDTNGDGRKILLIVGVVDLLASLGVYDAAIEVANINPAYRNGLYLKIVRAAISAKDTANVTRLAATTINALNEPAADGKRTTHLLLELFEQLTTNGYRNEAWPIFEQFSPAPSNMNVSHASPFGGIGLAEVRARMDDVPGALKAADDAGPLVSGPGTIEIGMMVAMRFAGRSQQPTEEEFKAAADAAMASLPPRLPGMKARALAVVARELAWQGDIEGAEQAAALLDVEPRGALSGPLTDALTAIVRAQIKAGQFRAALATTLRMPADRPQWERLLQLAAVRPAS